MEVARQMCMKRGCLIRAGGGDGVAAAMTLVEEKVFDKTLKWRFQRGFLVSKGSKRLKGFGMEKERNS
ncbi:hypothetical protein SLA2020_044710 [Shorea laevis]